MKRTLLAMALLVTSVFGVTGCGSDDDEAPVESRVKNVAPGIDTRGPSEAACGVVNELRDVLDDLSLKQFYEYLQLRDRCDAASKSGKDSPEGDDFEEDMDDGNDGWNEEMMDSEIEEP